MQTNFVLDYDTILAKQPHKLYLMVHLKADKAPDSQNRRPLNLSLVIDRSGSMAGEKIEYTRQAAQFLVQNLGTNDILSVVLYNDKVDTLLLPEFVQRKDAINERIATIKASGTTNLSGGWLAGCNFVAQNYSRDVVNRTILMSDGLANRGVTSSTQLLGMTRQKFQDDAISTTTMGLGRDFNEDLLMAMANAGGGAFYFIESPEVTPLIFKEELQGLLNVVGQNLTVNIQQSDHLKGINQLNAYPTHTDGTWSSYRMGDVFGDEVKALLIELSLNTIEQVGRVLLTTLRIEFDELTENGIEHRRWDLPVEVNVVTSIENQLANPEVKQSLLLLKAAQARKWAVTSADKGEYDTAAKILRSMASAIDESQINDESLLEERTALVQQALEIEQGADRYDEYSRKMMATQAFYTMTSRHEDTMMLRVRELQRKRDTVPEQPVVHDNNLQIERVEGIPPAYVNWNDNVFELTGDLIRLGRARHNEIIISAKGVSRFHCQIRRENGRLLLEDLGSTNGTVLDGIPLTTPHELNVGDVIYLCDEKLIFHDGSLK